MGNDSSYLKIGTILKHTYRIDRYIASGGFGNTYLAFHLGLSENVVVKEFFMKGVSERDANQTTVSVSNSENESLFSKQKKKFKTEAKRLWSIKNDHIVRVHDCFDENNTSYYVMDFIDGDSLSTIMDKNGTLSESLVCKIAYQILDALKTIHSKNIYHMDIKPGNVMMDKNEHCLLIDFGSSKQMDMDAVYSMSAMTFTNRYAPSELKNGEIDMLGPWTDLYSLGATIYNLLTGNKPPMRDVIDTKNDDAFQYPNTVSVGMRTLVRKLMQPIYTNRPKSAQEVVDMLDNMSDNSAFNPDSDKNKSSSDDFDTIYKGKEEFEQEKTELKTTVSYVTQDSNTKSPIKSNNNGILWFLISAILAVIVLIVVYFASQGSNSSEYPSPAPEPYPEVDTTEVEEVVDTTAWEEVDVETDTDKFLEPEIEYDEIPGEEYAETIEEAIKENSHYESDDGYGHPELSDNSIYEDEDVELTIPDYDYDDSDDSSEGY